MIALTALLLMQAPAPAPVAAPDPASVLLWRRGAGPAVKDPRAASRVVKLGELKLTEKTVHDVRGTDMHVRGVPLGDLLLAAPFDGSVDGVILHFANGTRVTLERKDVGRFGIFLARQWRVSDQGAWSSTFEPVPLVQPSWHAGRMLEFKGNRVLVEHPDPPRGAGTFVPWGYVDSLVEVEGVNLAAWRRVFDVGTTDAAKAGIGVWERRCTTCHGARGVGARLGWDFVEPLPVATWRTTDSLFDHVRAHKLNDAELGLIMPAQPDVTKEEIAAIHAWMETLATTPLNGYAP